MTRNIRGRGYGKKKYAMNYGGDSKKSFKPIISGAEKGKYRRKSAKSKRGESSRGLRRGHIKNSIFSWKTLAASLIILAILGAVIIIIILVVRRCYAKKRKQVEMKVRSAQEEDFLQRKSIETGTGSASFPEIIVHSNSPKLRESDIKQFSDPRRVSTVVGADDLEPTVNVWPPPGITILEKEKVFDRKEDGLDDETK